MKPLFRDAEAPKTVVFHATPQEARSFAATLSDEYLRCRRYGHGWDDFDVAEDRSVSVYAVTERCPSCLSERSYEISATTGRMITDYHIKYSDGYLSQIGRISGDARGMLVVERLRRRVGATKRVRAIRPRTHQSA